MNGCAPSRAEHFLLGAESRPRREGPSRCTATDPRALGLCRKLSEPWWQGLAWTARKGSDNQVPEHPTIFSPGFQ